MPGCTGRTPPGDAASSRCHAALTSGKARIPGRPTSPRAFAHVAASPWGRGAQGPAGRSTRQAALHPAASPQARYRASLRHRPPRGWATLRPSQLVRGNGDGRLSQLRRGQRVWPQVLQGLRGSARAHVCRLWVGERAGRALLRRVRGPAGRGRRRWDPHADDGPGASAGHALGQPGHRRGAPPRVGALRRPGRLHHLRGGARCGGGARDPVALLRYRIREVSAGTAEPWRSSSVTR